MANRTESCYDDKKLMCKFYEGTCKPLVRKVRLLDKDGNVTGVIQSHNEYKKVRKVVKAKKRKAYKEKCNG